MSGVRGAPRQLVSVKPSHKLGCRGEKLSFGEGHRGAAMHAAIREHEEGRAERALGEPGPGRPQPERE